MIKTKLPCTAIRTHEGFAITLNKRRWVHIAPRVAMTTVNWCIEDEHILDEAEPGGNLCYTSVLDAITAAIEYLQHGQQCLQLE